MTGTSIISDLGQKARHAQTVLSLASYGTIDLFLTHLSHALRSNIPVILESNRKDLGQAHASNLTAAQIDRLTLNPARIETMAQAVDDITAMQVPCGIVLEEWTRPNGLEIQKISVPIGVLGMIFESRPNVAIDAAALCVKSKNCVILRGGSDSAHTVKTLHALIVESLCAANLPQECVCLIPYQDRALVGEMLTASDYIDVIIPRGGKSLTSRVMAQAKMPVFAHLDGNCHLYVHPSAKPDLALAVIQNAKLRRTGICGALESLLFDDSLSDDIACALITMLIEQGVEVRGDTRVQTLHTGVKPAGEDDWSAEYLDLIISVKYVPGVERAAHHINTYGSHHTDGILAEDENAAQYFLEAVDSAIVLHNTSTQFADGGEFGFGAEIGIGTGKLHARGPVGLKQLTTFKYRVLGKGQVRP